jgi:hypothetical protein
MLLQPPAASGQCPAGSLLRSTWQQVRWLLPLLWMPQRLPLLLKQPWCTAVPCT